MPRPLAASVVAALLALAAPAAHARAPRHPPKGLGAVLLDGGRVEVRWSDGDSFKIRSGPHAGRAARLVGVNALETFGPVHRWGAWRGDELHALARATSSLAAAEAWRCTTSGAADGYGRLLVACPDLALALVRAGHALVLAVDAPPDPALVAAQRDARAAGAGIWAKGTPRLVPTSLHSSGEAGLGSRGAYDRVADAETGDAAARPHRRTYDTCEEVCYGEGDGRACLTYVPYERRYRHRPECLRPR